MDTRKIKVQAQTTPSRMFPFQQGSSVGKLTLSGAWLDAAGFPPGTQTEIEVRAGELIIRATEPPRKVNNRAPWAEVREELTIYRH